MSTAPFRTAVIDPPWAYDHAGSDPRLSGYVSQDGAEQYATMSQERLVSLPISDLVGDYLFLWTTGPFVPDAVRLVKDWGFRYRTMMYWIKTVRSSDPTMFDATFNRLAYGPGYWVRSVVEPIILASRNGAKALRTNERSAFLSQRLGHSSKPECLQDMVERHFPGPYLEMFARRVRPGWTCMGYELSGLDVLEEISRHAS